MSDTTSIFSSNTIYMSELKSKTLEALTHLEAAALSAGFSYTGFIDQVVPDPTGEYKLLDPGILNDVRTMIESVDGIHMDALPELSAAQNVDRFHDHVWTASQMNTIENTLLTYIETMGMPTQASQDAIFNAGKERIARTFNDSADLLAATFSGRGFKYANSMLNADLLKLAEDRNNAYYDQSRKIEELLINLTKDNLHFALQQGVAVESAHMDFAYKYSTIYQEIFLLKFNAVLEKYKADLAGEVSKLEAVVQAVSAQAALYTANANIEGKRDTAWLEQAKLEITQALGKYSTAVTELSQTNKLRLDAYEGYAKTISGLVNGATNTVLGVVTKKEA